MSGQGDGLLVRLRVYQAVLDFAGRRHRWLPAERRHTTVSRDAELQRLGLHLAGCSSGFIGELAETTAEVIDRVEAWTEHQSGLSLPADPPELRLVVGSGRPY